MVKINTDKKEIVKFISFFVSRRLVNALLFITMFLVVVFPNTFREVKIPLFIVIAIFIFSNFLEQKREYLGVYLAGAIFTLIYLLVGLPKSKMPDEAMFQVFTVYLVFPLFWILLGDFLLTYYSIEKLIKILVIFGIIGSTTVLVGIWLFDNGYQEILSLIIENPNKTFTESGVVAMRFHVYGSLIFIFSGFWCLYSTSNKLLFATTLILFIIVAVVSGRAALLVAIAIGFVYFAIVNRKVFFQQLIVILPVVIFITFILQFFNVDLLKTLSEGVSKISDGGGGERVNQVNALLEGIAENHLLGSGHGVGVNYLRSYEYPWRYEILPLATIFRVGIIGLLIYSIPFILSIRRYIFLTNKSNTNVYDQFIMIGLIAICITSFTNPYLESFEFQSFYFFGYSYFANRSSKKTRKP
jgi:hypothetical protein